MLAGWIIIVCTFGLNDAYHAFYSWILLMFICGVYASGLGHLFWYFFFLSIVNPDIAIDTLHVKYKKMNMLFYVDFFYWLKQIMFKI